MVSVPLNMALWQSSIRHIWFLTPNIICFWRISSERSRTTWSSWFWSATWPVSRRRTTRWCSRSRSIRFETHQQKKNIRRENVYLISILYFERRRNQKCTENRKVRKLDAGQSWFVATTIAWAHCAAICRDGTEPTSSTAFCTMSSIREPKQSKKSKRESIQKAMRPSCLSYYFET